MRIFQILQLNTLNTGSAQQMFQLAFGLKERGHAVTVISRPHGVLGEAVVKAGLQFCGLPFRGQIDLRTISGLRRLLQQERPDVVHVHKGLAHALAHAATKGVHRGAFVVNRGVSFPLDIWNRGKYRSSRVDRIITVCRQIKDVVVSSGRLPNEKVEVIYAGTDVRLFDPERWSRSSFRAEKKIDDGQFVIAHAGIRDWKGWQEVVDALGDVRRVHPHAHLMLIGCRNENEKSEVSRYAVWRGVGDSVTPVEYRTDMPNVLAGCDLVVDASWDGTGITGTIREGMAMGKPVVATNAGGNGELISSPEVGWLVPKKDHPALVAAIRMAIEDRERSAEVGRNARTHIEQNFSKELRISRVEQLYQAILESKLR